MNLVFHQDLLDLFGKNQNLLWFWDCNKIEVFYRFCLVHSIWKSLKKKSHTNFSILTFSINFCPIKIALSLFDRKFRVFKNSPNWPCFSIFNELLSTQNVNVARFARNVECDFFYDFQTLWSCQIQEKTAKLLNRQRISSKS